MGEHDFDSLQTLGTLLDVEFYRLPCMKCSRGKGLYSGNVEENIFAALALDKAITLAGIE